MRVFSAFQDLLSDVNSGLNAGPLNAVNAGFPSPARDYEEKKLDLNKEFIKHPAATFFLRCKSDAMTGAGIFFDDLLIVDRSLNAKDGDIVIAYYRGNFMVRRLGFSFGLSRFKNKKNRVVLLAENENYKSVTVGRNDELLIWGIVSSVVHKFRS